MWMEFVGGAACGGAGLMVYAVRGRSSRLFGPSVWRGAAGRRSLALTFDDGPSESTPALLDVLDRNRVRATFFQCGVHVERLPGVSRQVATAGHEIGNHTHTHAPLYFRSPAAIREELARAQDAIARAAAVVPRLFRAPYGARWFGVRRAQAELGLLGVMWTALGRDWKLATAGIAARLLRAAKNGAIFCLHDGRGLRRDPDIASTIDAVGRIVPELQARGFQFETVSELLCPKN